MIKNLNFKFNLMFEKHRFLKIPNFKSKFEISTKFSNSTNMIDKLNRWNFQKSFDQKTLSKKSQNVSKIQYSKVFLTRIPESCLKLADQEEWSDLKGYIIRNSRCFWYKMVKKEARLKIMSDQSKRF